MKLAPTPGVFSRETFRHLEHDVDPGSLRLHAGGHPGRDDELAAHAPVPQALVERPGRRVPVADPSVEPERGEPSPEELLLHPLHQRSAHAATPMLRRNREVADPRLRSPLDPVDDIPRTPAHEDVTERVRLAPSDQVEEAAKFLELEPLAMDRLRPIGKIATDGAEILLRDRADLDPGLSRSAPPGGSRARRRHPPGGTPPPGDGR